jgi:Lon protease-like protein
MSEENGQEFPVGPEPSEEEASSEETGSEIGSLDEAEVEGGSSTEATGHNGDRSETRLRLPVIPLRGTVVFPAVAAPIAAGREKTMRAIESAVEGDKLLFAVAQLDAETEEPVPEALFRVGTICRIAQMQKVPGGVQMVIQGDTRAAALEYREHEGQLEVVARRMEDMAPLDSEEPAFAALYKEVHERASEVSRLRGVPKEIVDHLFGTVKTPGELADLVAFYTELDVEEKQELLETLSVEDRLRKLLLHLQKQIGLLEAQEQIREKVQEELGERQREIYLREQMKAIQKELGEDIDSAEVEDLRERIEGLELPEAARIEVDRELRRLERIPRESAEAQVVRTYLEVVADLPWSETTTEQLDLVRAEEILDRDHYGLQDVKDRVLDFLAVRKLQEEAREDRTEDNEDDEGSPTPSVRKMTAAARLSCSWGRRASARRRSPSRSLTRWGASTSVSRWAEPATRLTFVVIDARTSGRCPGASSMDSSEPAPRTPSFCSTRSTSSACPSRAMRPRRSWKCSTRPRTTLLWIITWACLSTSRRSCSSRRPTSSNRSRVRCATGWKRSSSEATPKPRSWRSAEGICCPGRSTRTASSRSSSRSPRRP